MWKIPKDQLSISLPTEDFYLLEEEDFVYLCYGCDEKKIACFSAWVNAQEIERVANEYFHHIQKGGDII